MCRVFKISGFRMALLHAEQLSGGGIFIYHPLWTSDRRTYILGIKLLFCDSCKDSSTHNCNKNFGYRGFGDTLWYLCRSCAHHIEFKSREKISWPLNYAIQLPMWPISHACLSLRSARRISSIRACSAIVAAIFAACFNASSS